MRPRIKAQILSLWGGPGLIGHLHWGWQVFWTDFTGKERVTHFWTWPAALDFAVERVLDFRKINHLHLWQ